MPRFYEENPLDRGRRRFRRRHAVNISIGSDCTVLLLISLILPLVMNHFTGGCKLAWQPRREKQDGCGNYL